MDGSEVRQPPHGQFPEKNHGIPTIPSFPQYDNDLGDDSFYKDINMYEKEYKYEEDYFSKLKNKVAGLKNIEI